MKEALTQQKLLCLVGGKKGIKLSGHITQHTRVLSHLCAAHFSCSSGTNTKKHLCVKLACGVRLGSFSSDIRGLKIALKRINCCAFSLVW